MDRMSIEEAREAKIAELTAKKADYTKALIAKGDITTIREVGNCVTDYLAFAYEDLHKLVMGATTFEAVRDKVIASDAECEAIKAVEQMERRREEESIATRAERWLWARGVLQ
jgi:carbonic anhydrase